MRLREALEGKGHRLTGPRLQIVDWIERKTSTFTADEIVSAVAGKGEAGRAIVFRTLDLLVQADVLTRVRSDGTVRYARKSGTHRHHVVCTECGYAVEFDDCPLGSALARIAKSTNFAIRGHSVEVYGLCTSCQS